MGSVLQPILQAILMQNCLKTIALCGDIKQASQIEVTKENRYALRQHGVKDRKNEIKQSPMCTSNPFKPFHYSKHYFSLTS